MTQPTPNRRELAVQPSEASEHFTEKEFYLDEFRGRSLLIALHEAQLTRSGAIEALVSVARDLLPNDTRLLLVVDANSEAQAEKVQKLLQRRLEPAIFKEETIPLFPQLPTRRARAATFVRLDADAESPSVAMLTQIWSVLRASPLCAGVIVTPTGELAGIAGRLAERLRVHKLVLVEDEGGVCDSGGRQLSFMDTAMLSALLGTGEAEWTGLAHRRATLEAVRYALEGGVAAVNLCAPEGLERELFTYEGSGTLFTLEDYCRIAPLGIDDYAEVEGLIERGQREGFLKMRSPEEIARIVVCGFGATIGAHHLAGICALYADPYREEGAGEVVALYTVTRFKGEGVGRKLLAHVQAEAQRRGLQYLFACTTEARAQGFFERFGFVRVTPADVPAAKWEGYDTARRAEVAVYRMNLSAAGEVAA